MPLREDNMLRHQGGEPVKAGFYLNLDSWEVNTVSGTDTAVLAGSESTRYLRVPVAGMLVFAPLMGAVFAMFLPFIGIAMVAQYAAVKGYSGARQVAHSMVGALGPSWQPSTAHLTGSPDKKQATAEETGREADAKLESLEHEIAEQAEKSKKA
jgi:hypothetical protein